MAANYTCRACSRALSKCLPPKILEAPTTVLRKPHRAFSTTASSPYYASQTLSADRKLEVSSKLQPSTNPQPGNRSVVMGIAQKLRERAPLMTETYVAYGATRDLAKECIRPGDYKIPQSLERGAEIPTDENGVHLGEADGWWYDTLGLKPTFSNWAQITFIHMYMLQVRFRMFPKTHAPVWIQHLTNHAFYAAEDRLVVWHKFNANSVRQKHLKDMFSQWRAVLLAYDEGLMKGDAMLATALWRNLLSGREDVDFEKLAQIVGYMRRELKRLDDATDEEVAGGVWKFRGDPGEEAKTVRAPSRMMASSQVAKS